MDNELLLQQAKEMITNLSTALIESNTKLYEANEKLKTVEKITDTEQWFDFGEVAKMLNYKGYGRNNLLAFCRGLKFLQDDNKPYQCYVDRGYFKHILKQNEFNNMLHIVPVCSAKGIDFLRRHLDESVN